MKISISIPDDVFNKAEDLVRKQGISRSEFYVTAIRAFMASRQDNVTDLLNNLYAQNEGFDEVVERVALSDLPTDQW